jgi:glycosyltransferase involved in cell wall biosynthesis
MKILHLCLSNFYIDNYSYQENELVRQNIMDGHEVLVIASLESMTPDGNLIYLEPSTYDGADGAKVIRIPYKKFLPRFIMKKLRIHDGLFKILLKEKPDVVLFHSLCGWELLTVMKYKKLNPDLKFYADSHEDFNNSARSFISKWILHWLYYRPIIRLAKKKIDKILCISIETMNFVKVMYGLKSNEIEFFPLGGFTYSDSTYADIRYSNRHKFAISDEDLVFVQSGKMNKSKKLINSLEAFCALKEDSALFFIAGSIHESIAHDAFELIQNDKRIKFVGWLNSEDLKGLLCAADVYIQPGTQSATMQMSLCCRCAVILDDVPSHKPYIYNNGWIINDNLQLMEAISSAIKNPKFTKEMGLNSGALANGILDYKKLASRLYV